MVLHGDLMGGTLWLYALDTLFFKDWNAQGISNT